MHTYIIIHLYNFKEEIPLHRNLEATSPLLHTYHSFTAYILGDIIGDIRIHIQIYTCSLLYQLLLGKYFSVHVFLFVTLLQPLGLQQVCQLGTGLDVTLLWCHGLPHRPCVML